MTALPTVTFLNGATDQVFIGNTAELTLRFDNTATGTNVGYAPYINVVLPTNGADGGGTGNSPVNDGVSFISATYLGADVEHWLIEFDANGNAVHPFLDDATAMPLVLNGTPGQTLLVLRLPFGSFTTDQTPADIDLKLGVSNKADVGTPLGVTATAGFAYGSDPFDNPCCDPPVVGSPVTLDVEPVVAQLTKIYDGPEQETATGPSYPREWIVQGDFAPGQPFTNVKLTDTMPDGTVVLGAHLEVNGVAVVGGSVNINTHGDGTTTVIGNFAGTITGGSQVPTLVIDFYVEEFLANGTPVLDPATGGFRQLDDNAKLDADWNPIDSRDANTHITINPVGPENTITAKSIAVQKGVELVSGDMDGNGVPDWQPHGVLEYSLDGQVSNYFEMNGLVLKDTLGDGQTFGSAGFTPHIVISQGGAAILDVDLTVGEYTVAAKDANGKTYIEFDVSQVLSNHGLSTTLDGNGGALGGASHATNYNQATVLVTYRSTLDLQWTGATPGDDYVDQGDPINNDILYGGDVYNTGLYKEDDSHASVTLPVSEVGKSIFAINGDTAKGTTTFTDPSLVQSGDLITYRLTLDLPLTSAHSVKLTDFLPLPVLKVADSDANGAADTFHWDGLTGATPAAGHIAFGSTDTFHTNVPGATPTLSIDSVANSLTLNFGDVLNPSYPTTHLDLLFTIAVTDAPFGDGLYLTNQVTSSETNSFNEVSQDNAIIQVLLGEPRLKITKGVIGTDNPSSALDSSVGPVGFSAPGSSGNRFSGVINSDALDTTPVNANLSHADAGDTISFAIILENKGQGWKGAFDTLVRDTLPPGFEIPAGGLNLHVTFGDGTSVPFHLVGSGLFDPAGGLQLDDGSLVSGCIGTYDPTSAKNVVVITYDAHLVNSLQGPNGALVNTATIVNYAAQEGGINRAPFDDLPDTDTASVSVFPLITKVVSATSLSQTGTSQGSNGNADLAIGEQVTYTITVTLPEGSAKAVWLDDFLPTSNGEIKALSATVTQVGANLHGNATLAVGQTGALSDTNADGVADKLHFDFGDVTNTTDNITGDGRDTVTIQVVGVLTNAAGNTAGDVLTNTATLSATDANNPAVRDSFSATADIDVVEPHLSLDKSVNVSTADAGDTVTYTVTLTNNQPGYNAPAFDISIDDLLAQLPPNAQFLHGTVAIASGSAAATIVTGNGATDTGIKITAAEIDPGQHVTITFQAKVTDTATVGANVPNTSTSTASSLPGTDANERSYTNSDSANFHIAAPTVTKVISATSYADTGSSQYDAGNQDLKPGEVATYDITITLPEGDSPHLKVTDLLADILASGTTSGQLQYVAGSAQVVAVGSNLTAASAPVITLSDSNGNGTADQLVVDFGTVHNQYDNIADTKDQIVIRLQAKAVDVAANEPGDVLVNTVTVTTDLTSATAHADADFVQPHLLVDKSTPFTTGDAGDVATYTITIRHAADSHGNAYDVNLADLLAPGLQLVAGSATTSAGTLSTAGGKVNLHLDQYNLGAGTITVTYQARLLDDVVSAQSITNTATLDYHSSSAVQDVTEGRGLGGSDTATIGVLLTDSVVKTITGTSNTFTTGSNVALGEIVTYSITATVGEGGQHLLLSDTLPINLSYVSSQVLSVGASISGNSLLVGDAGTYNAGTGKVSFDFGTILNQGDNVVNVGDKVVVQVVAQVGAGAHAADVLTNTATVSGTDGANPYGVNPNTVVTGGSATVSVAVVAAAVGDKAFLDSNGNGVQDSGEAGVGGVTVQLLDSTNAVVGTATTAADGSYHFTNLVPGSYHEHFIAPAGWVISPALQGGNAATDSDANPATGDGASFTLTNGQTDNSHDIGLYQPITIGDYAFVDANGDGLQTPGESPLPGVLVKLLDGSNNVVTTATTNASGAYSFTGLAPGQYHVQFVTPATYTITPADQGDDALDSDANTSTGITPTRTYVSGDVDNSIDAGFYVPASLGDRAWLDANGNGIQDSGEANLQGAVVRLFDAGNNLVGTATTDANGAYSFTGLRPGTYHETFTAPSGLVLTQSGAGTANTDSDSSGAGTSSGSGPAITLVSGQNDITHDVGFYAPITIGDKVFNDVNANGVQDVGDAGISGATVKLVNGAGTVVATTTTDANGLYHFTNLAPGDYRVQFVTPASYTASPADQGGNDTTDSDASGGLSPLRTYASGDNDSSVDAGFYQTAAIGDRVWLDTNGNGVQDAADTVLGGIVVKLFDGAGHYLTETTTAADGSYLFSNLTPGQYQEQFVKPNGYQFTQTGQGTAATDSDATPATGYGPLITLTSGMTDLTHDAGMYVPVNIGDVAFEDMNGNGVQDAGDLGVAGVTVQLVNDTTNTVVATTTTAADGSYHFTELPPGSYHEVFTTAPGYVFTPSGQGTAATDSDANAITGVAPGFSLTSGQTDNTHDVGLYRPISIGDFTWVDVNGNGQQDSGEPALANVTVKLLNGSGGLVATTTTDASGAYTFSGLAPGAYQVQFVAPTGYLITPPDRGADASDSDALVANGKAPVHTYVSGDHDTTIDGGFYKPATIGDYVFIDDNGNGVQDAGDLALAGVTVKLFDSSNTLVGTTTTAADGSYHFSGLLPGDYHEQFITPANYVLTQTGQGTAATDSEANPLTGFGPTITVISDQTDNTHDAGMYIPVQIGNYAFEDFNGNGIQDAGDQPLAGMTVKLYNNVTGALVATATTAADGSYLFTVPPGSYFESFSTPLGFQLTKSGQGTAATDSDALGFQATSGNGAVFTLHSGDTDLTHDAGAFRPITIGDRVFEDQNGDGRQDAGDTNLAGVTVRLLDAANTVLATTTTDASGLYSFGNLPPGQYHVQVVPPAGFFFTTPDNAADSLDSDTNTTTGISPTRTYVSGDNDSTVDAGLWRPVTIGDRAWVDTNGDGDQDSGEAGLGGVTVTLVNEATGATYTTTTNASGDYLFTGLPPGTYHEVFTKPAGYEFTLQGQGTAATDSDAAQLTGIGPSFAITSGATDLTHDAGLYIPGHVKGTAFLAVPPSLCADKLPGAVFSGVTVNLVNAAGTVVASAITDASGNYQIDGVAPGTYQVQFVSPNGLVLIPQHSGWLHDGSDANPANGKTDSFVVLSGQTIEQEDGGFAHLTGTVADSPAMSLAGGSYTFSTAVHVEFLGGANVNLNAPGSYIVGGEGGLVANANAGGSILIGGTGFSSLNGGPNGGSVMMGGQGGANIEGTSGNDIIIGGCGPISAQGLGSSSAQGLGSGGGFLANLGGDLMIGGKGGDTLEFNHSSGTVYGGAGNDYIHASASGVLLAGGTNTGTIAYSAGQFSNFQIGDTVNGTGSNTTWIYQAGDGVQFIENFNPNNGDHVEVWGFGAPTAVGSINGYGVLYFGPNQAIVFNSWNPGNGPLVGINYHAESSVAPGAIDHINPQVPVVLASSVTTFYGSQGDDIAVGSDTATTFLGKGGNDYMVGGAGNDVFYANDGTGNTLKGNGGTDIFYGATGSDSIDGGSGADKVVYNFAHGSASLSQLANGDWEILKPTGADLLHDVEKLQFSDGVLTLATNTFVASLAMDPDFNGDGLGDLLFRNDDGTLYQWQMNGSTVTAQGGAGWASTDWQIAGMADFNGDARADILWQNAGGDYYLWEMNGTAISGGGAIGNPGGTWQINSIADFDGDGKADLLWRNADGALYMWDMDGNAMVAGHDYGTISNDWQVRTTGDFNGDGKADLLWQNSVTGDVYMWQMNGGSLLAQGSVGMASGDWQIIGTGDFNADHKADVLWQNQATGALYEWQMNGFGIANQGVIASPGAAWHVSEIEDLNGDHKADLVLTNAAGDVWALMVDGLTVASSTSLGNVGAGWHLV